MAFTKETILDNDTLCLAVESAGSNSVAAQATAYMVGILPVDTCKAMVEMFKSPDVSLDYYKVMGRIYHNLEDYRDANQMVHPSTVNALFFMVSIIINSYTAAKKGSPSFRLTAGALLARINEFHDHITKAKVTVPEVIPVDAEIVNANIGHAMLYYAESGANKTDIREDLADHIKMKEHLGDCTGIKAVQDAYIAERLEVRRALAAVQEIDMIASISKYRTLQAITLKVKPDWGKVLKKNYSFFLQADQDVAARMCYSHFNDLHTRKKPKVCIIGHSELIFCKNNFESNQLLDLFDEFESTGRIGERVASNKDKPNVGEGPASQVRAE